MTKLGFTLRLTNVSNQKVDSSPLKTYDMVLAKFLLQDSIEKVRFFEETFLLADISMKVVLKMLFLSVSNIDL